MRWHNNNNKRSAFYTVLATCLMTGITFSARAATPAVLTPDSYPPECRSTSQVTPPWLNNLEKAGAIVLSDYTAHSWYRDWEKTTLSRCTDLTMVRLNGLEVKPVKAIYWRSDRMPLFRGGEGRDPSIIFEQGFWPWKYDGNLFIPSGSRNTESGIVNTGYRPNYIFEMAYGIQTSGHQGYLIDAPGGVNMTKTSVYENLNKDTAPGLPKNVSAGDRLTPRNVVFFPGGIRREFIKGAFRINSNTHQLEYLPNPHYVYPQPQSDEYDLVVAEVGQAGSNGSSFLTVTPPGKLIGGITHRYKKSDKISVSVVNGSPKECWRVNLESRGKPTVEPLELTGNQETQPVIVVYRGKCSLNAHPQS